MNKFLIPDLDKLIHGERMTRQEQVEEAFKILPVTAGEVGIREILNKDKESRDESFPELDKLKRIMITHGVMWADEHPPDLSVYYEELRGQLKQRGEMLALAIDYLRRLDNSSAEGDASYCVGKVSDVLAKIEELKK